jgi:hypothetical protein
MELKTYGDLKKIIKLISLKQKGEKILSQGKEIALDQLLGLIPGASNAKSAFNFLTSAFKKPDTVKTNTWLDKLDIDDKMSAIVDDTVENGFLQFLSKTLEAAPDEKPLQPDFNMNKQMSDYLQNTYSGRFVAGVQESTNYNKEKKMKKVLIRESELRKMVRKMIKEQMPMNTQMNTSQVQNTNMPLSTDVAKIDRTINTNKIMQQNLSTIDKGIEGKQLTADILSRTNLKSDPTAKAQIIAAINNYFK